MFENETCVEVNYDCGRFDSIVSSFERRVLEDELYIIINNY